MKFFRRRQKIWTILVIISSLALLASSFLVPFFS